MSRSQSGMTLGSKLFRFVFIWMVLISCSSALRIETSAEANLELTPTTLVFNSPINTIVVNNQVQKRCVGISSDLPSTFHDATLILRDHTGRSFFYNLNTRESSPLPTAENEYVLGLQISSVHEFLAFRAKTDTGEHELIVTNSDGDLIGQLPWEDSWLYLTDWVDNDHLLIRTKTEQGVNSSTVLDPFTGAKQTLEYDLIDVFDLLTLWAWGDHKVNISPDLSRIVYPSGDGITIWDMRNVSVVTHLTMSGTFFGNLPKWAPDSSRIVVNRSLTADQTDWNYNIEKDQELFEVTRDGSATRLTYLTETFSQVTLGQYSWSPDGKSIAFWFIGLPEEYSDFPDASPGPFERLAVFNFATGDTINYCLPGTVYFSGSPVWSPDGTYLLVSHRIDQENDVVYLVHLQNQTAYPVFEDVIPIGWMATID